MAVTGPDFISLQVRDLERSAAFYERHLGLKRSDAVPRIRRPAAKYHPLGSWRAMTMRWIWLVPS